MEIHVAFSYPHISIFCTVQELTVIPFIKPALHILQFYMALGLGYKLQVEVPSVLRNSLLVSKIKGYFKLVTQSKGMFWPPIFSHISPTSKSGKPAIYRVSFLLCTDDSLTVVTAKLCLECLFSSGLVKTISCIVTAQILGSIFIFSLRSATPVWTNASGWSALIFEQTGVQAASG